MLPPRKGEKNIRSPRTTHTEFPYFSQSEKGGGREEGGRSPPAGIATITGKRANEYTGNITQQIFFSLLPVCSFFRMIVMLPAERSEVTERGNRKISVVVVAADARGKLESSTNVFPRIMWENMCAE